MKIYFAADSQAPEIFQKRFSQIVDWLNRAGITVMSNLVQKNIAGFSSQELEKIDQAGTGPIDQMDALIIEGSRPLAESGYLIAVALAYKKPILYLTQKNQPANKNLLHLQKDANVAKLLRLKNYSDQTLEKILVEFLPLVERGEGRETAAIKFTLRLTRRTERYLQWKTNNTKLTKADYLRQVIEDLLRQDKDYQKFIAERSE